MVLVLHLNIFSMYQYKINLKYEGTAYSGWQIQDNQKTIQGCLNLALKKITKSEDIKSIGSGRTDAGVHALGQIVKVELPFAIEAKNLVKAINSNIEKDIRVIDAELCSEDFHPIFSAKSKEYLYLFSKDVSLYPHLKNLVAEIDFDLDFEKMNEGLKLFIGEKDFCNFYTVGTPQKTTIRNIFELEIKNFELPQYPVGYFPEVKMIRIHGDGFMKQMVRLISGTLFELGRGKIELSQIKEHLAGEKYTTKLAPVAPAHGLYLYQVHY